MKLEVRNVKVTGPLKCECGNKLVVIDDAGSIACPDKEGCGFRLQFEMEACVFMGDEIEWVE